MKNTAINKTMAGKYLQVVLLVIIAVQFELTLTLDGYAGTEKISNLSRKLNTSVSPSGYHPKQGDISWYAPWCNLAIFFKDFGYANGLVKPGEIKENIRLLQKPGSLKVRIELIE